VDASRSGVNTGERIKVSIEGSLFELEVMLRADLPCGVAGLPAGLSPVGGINLSAFCTLAPVLTEPSRGAP
jgi:NADH-quinone oxidoreductase subunit G